MSKIVEQIAENVADVRRRIAEAATRVGTDPADLGSLDASAAGQEGPMGRHRYLLSGGHVRSTADDLQELSVSDIDSAYREPIRSGVSRVLDDVTDPQPG